MLSVYDVENFNDAATHDDDDDIKIYVHFPVAITKETIMNNVSNVARCFHWYYRGCASGAPFACLTYTRQRELMM